MNRIGIIGYDSMGKMLLTKLSESGKVENDGLFISNKTRSKIEEAPGRYTVCSSNVSMVLNMTAVPKSVS